MEEQRGRRVLGLSSPEANELVGVLAIGAIVGVVIALGFAGFEELLHRGQHYVWFTLAGDDPNPLVTIGLATAGGLALGLALRYLPGHGGAHPADSHRLMPDADPIGVGVILASLAVGLVGLVGGASLGPEGAMLPAAAGASALVARTARLAPRHVQLVQMAGLAALLAAMFGSPLAGVVPLMELVPATLVPSMTLLVLPSLTSAATAVLTLNVIDVEPIGRLPFVYEPFRASHLVWAVIIGVIAGGVGLAVDRTTHLLRRITIRLDARSVLLTTTCAGLVLGVLYAIGGTDVRFSGVPELVHLVDGTEHGRTAVLAVVIKVLVTGLCLAAGYRGGRIFPVAFVGGATGLAIHLFVADIPEMVAIAVGLSAAMGVALGTPVTAALIAASMLSSDVLPLALLGIVAAHAVHLLADQLTGLSSESARSERAPASGSG